ncbi:MAG TPA: nucleotide pyrophosphatase/phosphodiesterase family protein [Jatrophihabitantaceae bacterium]|nr:nucleotide pyrophosphatase/phosphodiesterase family protein [Jatrophihabitantaceae bacterium]
MTNRGGLADVLVSASALLGVPGTEDRLRLAELVGAPRRICVLLIDGMGYHLLPTAAPHAPLLADVLAGRTGTLNELSCSFPSTTPTSLATLGTGTLPGAHGVLGFTVNVPGTDRVLTHVRWRDDPEPRDWQPEPSLFDRAEAAGTRVAVVSRPEFAGSGLTIAAYGTPRYVGAEHADQLAEGVLAELAAGPGLVYGYHPTLDAVAHEYGIASPDWARAASAVDRLINRIVDSLPEDAALFVTADHGALDIPAEGRIDLDADPRLTDGVRVVAGEPRVRYLHTVPGATPDVLATWRDVLAGKARVLARAEAVAAGLFGPVRDEHLARIGDVVVIAEGDTVVLASAHEPASVGKLVAFHGALTPAETAIPLIGLGAG